MSMQEKQTERPHSLPLINGKLEIICGIICNVYDKFICNMIFFFQYILSMGEKYTMALFISMHSNAFCMLLRV